VRLAASGFMDTTRVASGDPGLWGDICMANRTALGEALRAFAQEVAAFADVLESGDAEGVADRLRRAKKRRDERLDVGGTTEGTEDTEREEG